MVTELNETAPPRPSPAAEERSDGSRWRPPVSLKLVFGVLLLLALVSMAQEYVNWLNRRSEGDAFDLLFVASSTVPGFLLWTAFCPLLYWFYRSLGGSGRLSPLRVLGHALLSVGIAFVHRILALLVLYSVFYVVQGEWYGKPNAHTYGALFGALSGGILTYWAFFGTFLALEYYGAFRENQLRLARIETELTRARLSALRMQLHPHFLFNTLHTISSLMDEDVGGAQKMVAEIGYLLRSMLDAEHRSFVTLEEELRFVRAYLGIEQTRFRDRLRIEYDVPEALLDAEVPHLVLQPLVENAIKHGFSRRTDAGLVRVSAQSAGGTLSLSVEDDGRGSADPESRLGRGGIGLTNTRRRLQQLYGEAAGLHLESEPGAGFAARLELPLRSAGSPEER